MERLLLPKERLGAAIGASGSVKSEIERRTGTRLTFDSETGEVLIELAGDNPLGALQARDILNAVARGFSPEKAFSLLEENRYLEVIDISDYAGRSDSAIRRLKGRVIGEAGKTRRTIEQMTGTLVSVYGKTIALVGTPEQLEVAKGAVEMLLRGSPHSAVYRFLERKRPELRRVVIGR